MQHFYKNIEGWAAFGGLYVSQVHLAKATEKSTFVEVGSWLGRSAALMAVEIENSGKPIEFVCVDPWLDGGPDLRGTEHFKKHGVNHVYDLFCKNIYNVRHRIKAMRMLSTEAAAFMQDNSVDFLMLDGDHSYEAVKADIAAWMPKMKQRGGVISGDDYLWPGVKQAVDEEFGSRANIDVVHKDRNYLLSASYWSVLL